MNIKELTEIKALLGNDSYFTWLESFTTDKPIFVGCHYPLVTKDLTKTDINNIKNTILLFKSINHYSKNKYISPQKNQILNNYYNFKNNNTYYTIGIINKSKNTLSCQKTNKPPKDFIDINDIKTYFNYYELNERLDFAPTLENLQRLITTLLNNGITPEEIENVAHKSLTKKK